MNPGIRILTLPSAIGLSEGGWAGGDQGRFFLFLWMNHKLANGIKMCKGNWNTTIFPPPLKGLGMIVPLEVMFQRCEILHLE